MSEFLPAAARLALVLAALYALVCVWAHWQAPRMLFLRPAPTYAPGEEHIRLVTPDGVTLFARHWPNPAAKHTLFYFSGNAEELGAMAGYLPEYVKAGFAVFAYDYRGHGHSGGMPSERSARDDAKLALDWLEQNGVPRERVIAFGFSVGAGSAVELARTEPLAGLIIEAGFVSAYRVMTRRALVLGDKFENEKKLRDVRCPVFVIHGDADAVIPVWHGEALFAAANEPKRKLIVPGGGHGGFEAVLGERYVQALQEFAASLR